MPSLPPAIVRPLLAAAVVLVSLAAATQWTAALLAHHPALGAPWLDVLGLKLYAPWKVFSWWLAFGAQAPGVFARTGTLAALGGVMAGLVASGGAARRAGHGATPSTTYGSARWASSADVREARLFSGKGVVLGVRDGRYLRHDGPEHVLAVAPTRSGKGVGLVVPTSSPGRARPSSTTSRARTGSSPPAGGRRHQAPRADRVRSLHRVRRHLLLPHLLLLRRRRAHRLKALTPMLGQPSPLPGYEVPLHRALTEPILIAGAPRAFAILNGTLAAAIGLGLRLWLAGLLIWIAGHAVAVWVTKHDPAFLTVLSRHTRHKGALTC